MSASEETAQYIISTRSSLAKKDESSLPPRRVHAKRRSKSRASASPGRGPLNNGLMAAAWPKTQSYRAIKTKTQGDTGSQGWITGDRIFTLMDQVEEMEVDSHDNSLMLSCGAAAELKVMKAQTNNYQTKPSPIPIRGDKTSESVGQKSLPNKEGKPVGRRLSEPVQPTTSSVVYKTRKSEPTAIKVSSDKGKRVAVESATLSKAQSDSEKSSNLRPIFIMLHVGKIDFGTFSGSATGPVKIFAERIMVQMENQLTKEDISFRIMSHNITKIEASVENQPFFLKLKANRVQWTNQGKSKRKNNKSTDSVETITLHLAYERDVPLGIKRNLRELFKERLGDLNLWKESSSGNVTAFVENTSQSPAGKQNLGETETRKNDTEQLVGSSSRKTSPIKQDEVKVTSLSSGDVARRVLFQDVEDYKERVKSLENEAAQYQLMLGHKRLEVQHLEKQISDREQDVLIARQEAEIEIASRDSDICLLQSQIDTMKLEINEEKEATNAQRRQILELQRTLAKNSNAMEEQQQAILVRDNQLKQVRAIATIPSNLNESELRDRVKRLENDLRHAWSTLDETRRSKNGMSEELNRNFDVIATLRQQLQLEISQNRRLEEEAAATERQMNDYVDSRRSLEIELSDERDRVTSLERERLSSHRRFEEEIDRRADLEDDCRQLRSSVEDKQQALDELRAARDNAVTEVGVLKRELQSLSQQAGESEAVAPTIYSLSDCDAHDWIIDRDEVVIQNALLGEGGWGQVKLGNFRGTDVAVKQIHQLILSPHNRRLFNREMTIAARCRHPCLLQFIGATCDDGIPLFLSELMETDLRSCLARAALVHAEVITLGMDVALALNYLHKQRPVPIIHRDISSANVLIWYKGQEMHGKLSDYGAANFMRISMTRHPGASLYSAPETASGEQTTKVDVFSFGVLLCEMSIRELPVVEHRSQQIASIAKVDHQTLVLRCVEKEPEQRPSADEIIRLLAR